MKRGGRMVQSGTREPLLRETERDAVNNLLKYLEHGVFVSVCVCLFVHTLTQCCCS